MSEDAAEFRAAEERIRQLARAGRHPEAEIVARELVAADPDSSTTRLLLVDALLAQDRPREALEHAEVALELHPEDHRALISVSECRLGVGDRGGAVTAADRAVTVAPWDWTSHYSQARAHLDETPLVRDSESLDAVKEALRLAPTNADVHNMHGLALERLARHAEARASFERALELDPMHAHALTNLALYDVDRRPTLATQRLTEAVSLDPQSEVFRTNVAAMCELILIRLTQLLQVAGLLFAVARLFGPSPTIRGVLVLIAACGCAATLQGQFRALPRAFRRSPRTMWANLGDRPRWYAKLAALFLVLDLLIALAPGLIALLAFDGLLLSRVVQRRRTPRDS